MTKEELSTKILSCDDAVVTYRSINSSKLKYNVVTLDFKPKYIQQKTLKAVEDDDTLLVFCWDTDSFKLLKPETVTSVVPISYHLRNPEIE